PMRREILANEFAMKRAIGADPIGSTPIAGFGQYQATEVLPSAESDHDFVGPAVIDQGDRCRVDGLTVEGGGLDPVLDPFGILDHDSITRRPIAIGDLEAGPAAGDAGVDLEVIPSEVEPEDCFQADAEEPGGRPGIPGPPPSARVR